MSKTSSAPSQVYVQDRSDLSSIGDLSALNQMVLSPQAASMPPSVRSDDPTMVAPKPLKQPVSTTTDRLGTLLNKCSAMLDESSSWKDFVSKVHGPSSLQDNMQLLDHPAGEFLASLHEHGVPCIQSDPDWTLSQLDERMARGCHRSATEHKAFIRDEMADFVDSGFYAVLPYSKVRHLPGLRLSPLGIKEERDRRARLVVDHTWFGVNLNTMEYTTKEAMQFGGALYRVLAKIHHADPKYGKVFLAKYDIKDGFYRMMIRPEHTPSLAVIMPRY